MTSSVDFAATFARLAAEGAREETVSIGGVDVRMVRVAGGGEGRWDHHDHSAETVVVWSGDFTVEFRDHTLELGAGQCCVVPVNAEHRGTSRGGAEVVLFQTRRPHSGRAPGIGKQERRLSGSPFDGPEGGPKAERAECPDSGPSHPPRLSGRPHSENSLPGRCTPRKPR